MPQLRFLLRASLLLAAFLAFWWFVLRHPLLEWVQFSSEILLQSLPGVHTPTGVSVEADRVWVLQVPTPGPRSIRIRAEERIPTMYTVALPLFWAILAAAPWSRRLWRALGAGTALLLLVPPVSLLIYAAHVVKLNLYLHSAPALGYFLNYADYLAFTVVPFLSPVFLAFALYPDLRSLVFTGQPVPERPSRAR
jgi:hypothetical protein